MYLIEYWVDFHINLNRFTKFSNIFELPSIYNINFLFTENINIFLSIDSIVIFETDTKHKKYDKRFTLDAYIYKE